MRNPYLLDKQGLDNLRTGQDSIYQALSLIDCIQKAYSDDEHIELYTALNGVKTLIDNGLNDLAEV